MFPLAFVVSFNTEVSLYGAPKSEVAKTRVNVCGGRQTKTESKKDRREGAFTDS